MFLNETEAGFGAFAHQLVDPFLDRRLFLIFVRQGDADQRSGFGVHRRFAQLAGVHLAQPLEAADLDLLALEHGRFQFGAVRVVLRIGALAARGQAVERRRAR
jgi:hypothetical protein